MNVPVKCPLFFLLFSIAAFNGYGQLLKTKSSRDTTISMNVLFHFKQDIYYLKEKIKLQQYEIRVLKELVKIDSVQFGKDSLVSIYTSKAGIPLLRITQKRLNLQNNYDDSTVVYYNKNGFIEYSEMWHGGKNNPGKTKLTCRRYEYDDQNRVIRYVVNYPTPRNAEYTYTYDSLGNATRHENPKNIDFWD